MSLRAVLWKGGTDGCLRVIDQRRLPARHLHRDLRDVCAVWKAIRTLAVRGAPAIGVAAAFGAYLGVRNLRARAPRAEQGRDRRATAGVRESQKTENQAFLTQLGAVCDYLRTSRPTAVNLPWALDRVYARAERELQSSLSVEGGEKGGRQKQLAGHPHSCPSLPTGSRLRLGSAGGRGDMFSSHAGENRRLMLRVQPSGWDVPSCRAILDRVKHAILDEAKAILEEDRAACRAIGENGLKLLRNGMTVLTHCNAGALATSEYGTALAPIYRAHERGWKIRVFAGETRPLLQGARLTVWELHHAGIDVTLLCDVAAASLLHAGKVDCVLVGADRIAANGDAANKVGTLMLAIIAKECRVPFYALAPSSSFDPDITSGKAIPIERRDSEEVTKFAGKQVAARGVQAYNPAFDVTPAKYITAFVSEKGVFRPPYSFGKTRR
jgi:methylthioribose-1-phosphate isomerase